MRFISLPIPRKPSLTACLCRQGYYRYAHVPLPAQPLKFIDVGLGLTFHPIQRQTWSDASQHGHYSEYEAAVELLD